MPILQILPIFPCVYIPISVEIENYAVEDPAEPCSVVLDFSRRGGIHTVYLRTRRCLSFKVVLGPSRMLYFVRDGGQFQALDTHLCLRASASVDILNVRGHQSSLGR